MGRLHKAVVAAAVIVFLLGNAVAIALPHRTPAQPMQMMPPTITASPDLIIPVEGVTPVKLTDTWGAARDQGRHHEGIDIMALTGTPVRAAAPGRIAKLFHSVRGGTTIYEFDQSGQYIFYYAHLSAYAADVHEGQTVGQGQLIAYVGRTGNATTPHLHFEIQRTAVPGQWWHGVAFNPYMPLKTAHMPEAGAVAAR